MRKITHRHVGLMLCVAVQKTTKGFLKTRSHVPVGDSFRCGVSLFGFAQTAPGKHCVVG